MTKAEAKYEELLNTTSDINLHLPTIRKYVSEGDTVVELGVRTCVSTWALLVNRPKVLLSVDVVAPPQKNLEEVIEASNEIGTKFGFSQQDSIVVDFQSPVDVLFIDTLHYYSHLVKELWRHARNTRKYIIFHDYLMPDVTLCVHDFLYNSDWELAEVNEAGTGLAVVKRVR